ncbi:hypothetical protein GH714_039644 [Hevea brasiliensis]|uniref:N-acetyltransferase domain-containing protein n=1 Tax=Hevea brasiliensis TaxID=3981 RepID=A0A6A6KEG8_HEVBR|nr:hypothetical protein GH714_039644 [Hevea brasiliensis]
MLSSTIEDLSNDGFGGSQHEKCIFAEVFFGKDTGGTSKRSQVSGLINFECENSKIADSSLCSNSENSALTSQCSSKSSLVDDSEMNENSGGASASCCFQERLDRDDQNMSIKRMKFSVDGPSGTEPDTVKILTSTVVPKEIVDGVPAANRDLAGQTTVLYIVESSCQDAVSSCYLSKQQIKLDGVGDVCDKDVLKCRLPNADGNAGKEVVICKAVASPVSQESFATRLFHAKPSAAIVEKSGSPIRAEERLKELDSPGLGVSNYLKTDSKKDPRPFLQSHIVRILLAAGWFIGKRKRPSRKYSETVYRSPSGRMFREFPKVWRLCGQILYADGYKLAQEENFKEWTNITHFWSDLSEVLLNIEKEIDQTDVGNALAHQWSLLDPFVNVVFIDRKVGLLRKGDTVKAGKGDTVMALMNDDSALHQSAGGNMHSWHSDSSLATQNASTIWEVNQHACIQQSGDISFSKYGEQTNGFVKGHENQSIYVVEREEMCSVDVASGMGNRSFRMCKDKVSCLDMTSLPPCGSESTCVQLSGCQCDASVTDGNANVLGGSESASPHQDSSLVDVDDRSGHLDFSNGQDEPTYTQSVNLDVAQQTELSYEDGQCIQASSFKTKDKTVVVKRKTRRKSRKISEIRTTLYQSNHIHTDGNQLEPKEVKENLVANSGIKTSCKKLSPVATCLRQADGKGSKLKKMHHNLDACKRGQKRPTRCLLKDDDLLVSAIIKNKDFSSGATKSTYKRKAFKSRAQIKLKNQKGGCSLLPRNLSKVGKQYNDGKWSIGGTRTVLSWLVHNRVISVNDVIQYRNPKDDAVIKDGLVTKDGIIYHETCWKRKNIYEQVASDTWLCRESCREVYSGLHSHVGISNPIADGFCWTLLRCIHEDQKVHSAQRFALKAEWNSKLAVALTIMEECFQSMLDPRTGIDMIPHVLYNWGSEFARLNFHGFYTVVLEKDDVLLSVACIRVHGATVAEMPLIATCSNYRRHGMCRRLMNAIEEMLISFKVEKLVISAIPDLVETWTEGFGFTPVSNDEKQSLNKINLMVFPGTILLKKQLHRTNKADTQSEFGTCLVGEHGIESLEQFDRNRFVHEDTVKMDAKLAEIQNLQESEFSGGRETADAVKGPGHASPSVRNEPTKLGVYSDEEPPIESVEPSDGNYYSNEDAAKLEEEKLIVVENQDSNLQEQFSKLSCEVERNQAELACNVQSVNDEPSLDGKLHQVFEINGKK